MNEKNLIMQFVIRQISFILILFFSINSFASSLAQEAQNRGISQTCINYLSQIESSYGLNGLNITFAHPESPSVLPSLHISTQKFNNGSSSFSATLMPDEEYCYLSTVHVTAIHNQSCAEIAQIKIDSDQNLKVSTMQMATTPFLLHPMVLFKQFLPLQVIQAAQ